MRVIIMKAEFLQYLNQLLLRYLTKVFRHLNKSFDATICNAKRIKTGALENLGNLKSLTKENNIFEATGKCNESLNNMYSH